MTREEWLSQAITELRPHFEEQRLDLPERIRVSCGWPTRGGLSEKKRVIGQCFDPVCSRGGVTEVFISPYISEASVVLETLVHELVHAAIGCDKKHGTDFRAAMKQIGLVGKPTATTAGDDLRVRLTAVADALGDYPHQGITRFDAGADTPKKQKNRHLKVACTRKEDHENGEDYTLRGSQKVLSLGVPVCPLCGTDMVIEEPEEKDDDA